MMNFDRHRRMRRTAFMRDMVRETRVTKEDLIYPIFVVEADGVKKEVPSMKGVFQVSLNLLEKELEEVSRLGIKSVICFGISNDKGREGTGAYHDHGVVREARRISKRLHPEILVRLDTCLCAYTDHGPCGLIDSATEDVDNGSTLPPLVRTAVSQAK